MVNSNNVTRKFTMKEKLASLGPGFVIVGSFIGPGTVTSCTLAGATYGFTLFWCVVFSVIAVIVMQGMAARIGIITQEGLAENMKHDFADRPLLRNILCGLVIIAITIGGLAYMGGDLTGTAMGASALTGVPTRIMAPILGVIVLIVLLFVGDAVKYLEKLLSVCHLNGNRLSYDNAHCSPRFWRTAPRLHPDSPEGRTDDMSFPHRNDRCSVQHVPACCKCPENMAYKGRTSALYVWHNRTDDHRRCYHRFHYDHIRSGYARHEC